MAGATFGPAAERGLHPRVEEKSKKFREIEPQFDPISTVRDKPRHPGWGCGGCLSGRAGWSRYLYENEHDIFRVAGMGRAKRWQISPLTA
jgi:hypothetical protein